MAESNADDDTYTRIRSNIQDNVLSKTQQSFEDYVAHLASLQGHAVIRSRHADGGFIVVDLGDVLDRPGMPIEMAHKLLLDYDAGGTVEAEVQEVSVFSRANS